MFLACNPGLIKNVLFQFERILVDPPPRIIHENVVGPPEIPVWQAGIQMVQQVVAVVVRIEDKVRNGPAKPITTGVQVIQALLHQREMIEQFGQVADPAGSSEKGDKPVYD